MKDSWYYRNHAKVLAARKVQRATKKDYHRERGAASYATARGRAGRMVTSARKRAKAQGVPFDLTVDWVQAAIERGFCEISGRAFDLGPSQWGKNPDGPSLDRINPGAGYCKDNVRVVTWHLNVAMHEYGLERLIELMRNVK